MGTADVHANYNAIGIDVIEQMYGDDFLSFGGTETTDALADWNWMPSKKEPSVAAALLVTSPSELSDSLGGLAPTSR
ncbi:MAG: hypothetical protein ACI8TP_000562 [Acidimicrobiales bacterium]|jgi:hypothetical protein